MPYFFILPGFVLYLVAMALAVLATTVYQPATWARPYLISVLIWSSIGFIASIVLFVAVAVVALETLNALHSGNPSSAVGIAIGLLMFGGPFVAAATGLGGGAVFGIWRAAKRVGEQSSR
jgi:hypothetical protein